jgi:hypothetical protein
MLRKLWLGSVVVGVLLLVGWGIVAPPSSSSYVPGYGDGDCRPEKSLLPMVVYHYLSYFDGAFEVEPNNTYQEANGALRSGQNYQGYPNDQRDYFSFYVQTAGPIHITLDNHTGIQTQLQLFYQSTDNRVGYDPEAPFEISYNGQPGWYYIYIFTGSGYNNTTAYTLHTTFPVPPTPTAITPVATPTCAGTAAPSATPTKTFTPSITPSNTPGPSPTPTFTPTNGPSPTPIDTPTPTLEPGWYEVGSGSASGGGISNSPNESQQPSAVAALDGMIYVAWHDGAEGADYEIYIRRWNGSNWAEVGSGSATGGGISNNSGQSYVPSVAVAPNNTPYIAWHDDSVVTDVPEIYVRRWNGSSWEEVGTGSATGGGISNNINGSYWPSAAVDPNGMPYVAWEDGAEGGDYEIYVRRWNGSSWEEVGTNSATGGGISMNNGNSFHPSVAIAPDGTPYVAWDDDGTGDAEVYVRRWNGSSWEEVGTGSATGGGISNNGGGSSEVSIAIAPDGTPYVAWRDTSGGDDETYVRRWNGSNWEEVGVGSASGGGISNNSGGSHAPSIAIASDNTPYVAWHDNSSGNDQIYVRRWNGSSWEEVGTGSASGSGISNNSGASLLPALAVAVDDTPYAAWWDNSGNNFDIYVRQWLGP